MTPPPPEYKDYVKKLSDAAKQNNEQAYKAIKLEMLEKYGF